MHTVVVLEGDHTGQELLEEALRLLEPAVIGVELDLPRLDLCLQSRRATRNAVVYEAARAIREHAYGLQAATITPGAADGVGSPSRTRARRSATRSPCEGARRAEAHGQPRGRGSARGAMAAAAERDPRAPYEPQPIDATFALPVCASGAPLVVPALSRDGDIFSELVLPLFGPIAGSELPLVAFGDDVPPSALAAEAAHGAAHALQGEDVASPMAVILAAASLPSHAAERDRQDEAAPSASPAWRRSRDGQRTAELGGHVATRVFTDEVIRRTRTKLELCATL